MPVNKSEVNKVGYFGYSSICETVCSSTYALFVIGDNGEMIGEYGGSGFAVSSDGLLITATHVIDGLKNRLDRPDCHMALTRDTSPFKPQKEIYTDIDIVAKFDVERSDISVLSVNTDDISSYDYLNIRQTVPFESMGQPVAAFGYPTNDSSEGWNIAQKTTAGVIADIDTHGSFPAYEVDTLFHPGFSGGPLVSLRNGDVIGVVHSRGRYLDEFNSRKFPAPSHLSQANAISDEPSRNITIGSKLVELGVSH